MKNRYLVLVLTEPTEGNEARFNDYYENKHLDEVISSTGWQSAQRFRWWMRQVKPVRYLILPPTRRKRTRPATSSHA